MELNEGSQISISLSGDDEAELTGYYEKLVDGGTVIEPLSKAPWGDSFGMAVDRFGVAVARQHRRAAPQEAAG